jgi:hypothetical protein
MFNFRNGDKKKTKSFFCFLLFVSLKRIAFKRTKKGLKHLLQGELVGQNRPLGDSLLWAVFRKLQK